MKIKCIPLLVSLSMFIFLSGKVKAQYRYAYSTFTISVNAASVIKVTPSTPISIYMNPTIAGSGVTNTTNSDSYLKVTSIAAGGATKTVVAQITSGTVPNGTLLKLSAALCTTGSGTFGAVFGQKTLNTTSSVTLISGIGNCYTGSGTTDGYNLTYSWELDPNNLVQLKAHSSTAAFITFTISSW